jgi:ubiquinone/menaquinone biosynthesis C-methylase UbiE
MGLRRAIGQQDHAGPRPPVRADLLRLLRCPVSGDSVRLDDGWLVSAGGHGRYRVSPTGIPLFAEHVISHEGRAQQEHYDAIASAYLRNLTYPHTQEYLAYLDRAVRAAVGDASIGAALEICCGHGEGLSLLRDQISFGLGVDVSLAMLEAAQRDLGGDRFAFVQGDATMLPLADGFFDIVLMLGGIHHVNDRHQLFREVFRMLRPGGRFLWREPVSDFLVWRALRAVVYRLAPALDHTTERPLLFRETLPPLERAGLQLASWRTYGFLGFCFLMNSDVLVFNRLFRFVPGIRALTRLMTRLDDLSTRLPGLQRAGLQVIGVAEKPDGAGPGMAPQHATARRGGPSEKP